MLKIRNLPWANPIKLPENEVQLTKLRTIKWKKSLKKQSQLDVLPKVEIYNLPTFRKLTRFELPAVDISWTNIAEKIQAFKAPYQPL